jgi:hypothetical protein
MGGGRLPQPDDLDAPTVYINQWVPATLTARRLGVSINMEADLYVSGFTAPAKLTLGLLKAGPVDLSLALRIPSWALVSALIAFIGTLLVKDLSLSLH